METIEELKSVIAEQQMSIEALYRILTEKGIFTETEFKHKISEIYMDNKKN